MNNLLNRLNSFDYYFAMSDSSRTYDLGSREKESISRALAEMTDSELLDLRSQIEVSDNLLSRHFPELVNVKAESSYRSMLFKTAWFYFKKGIFTSFGEALKAAWKRVKSISKLKSGQAQILYRKADGTLRRAKGTLKDEVLAFYPGRKSKSNPDVIAYWDLEKLAWRAFRIERLISITA